MTNYKNSKRGQFTKLYFSIDFKRVLLQRNRCFALELLVLYKNSVNDRMIRRLGEKSFSDRPKESKCWTIPKHPTYIGDPRFGQWTSPSIHPEPPRRILAERARVTVLGIAGPLVEAFARRGKEKRGGRDGNETKRVESS